MGPKVSVIIPNYNHEAYLKQRIDSVLNQTYTNFEIILLDDCSTDQSRDVIASYATHPKITVLLNDTNSGSTFRQWNKGLHLAKGELIWIAESDDVADHAFLTNAVAVLTQAPDVGLYECSSYWIDKNSALVYDEVERVSSQKTNGKTYILNNLLNGNSIHNASAVVFRKNLVNLPLTDDIINLKYCGDWLFWVKILTKSNFYRSGDYHNYFRRHEGNVSGNAEKNGLAFLEGIRIYAYIRKIYKQSFLAPIKTADRIWAFTLFSSGLSQEIKTQFLKSSIKVNPFINLLYQYYSLKQGFKKSV